MYGKFIFFLSLSLVSLIQAIEITWFGHSAFRIKSVDTVLFIDPWITNLKNPDGASALAAINRADYILITHGHGDHLGNTRELLDQTTAKVITSYGLGNQLIQLMKYPPHRVTQELLGDVGGSLDLSPSIRIHFMEARHSSEVVDSEGKIHFGGHSIGFLIEFKDGKVVYHTGDTDVFMDMKIIPALYPVDILLTCIGGQFTMDPRKAALATAMVRPKIVIPMHYGTYPLLRGTTDDFKSELEQVVFEGKLKILEVNKIYDF